MAGKDHGEMLTKFDEIFGTALDHEVIKLILQNCEWDATASKDILLGLVDKTKLAPHIQRDLSVESVATRSLMSKDNKTDLQADPTRPTEPIIVYPSDSSSTHNLGVAEPVLSEWALIPEFVPSDSKNTRAEAVWPSTNYTSTWPSPTHTPVWPDQHRHKYIFESDSEREEGNADAKKSSGIPRNSWNVFENVPPTQQFQDIMKEQEKTLHGQNYQDKVAQRLSLAQQQQEERDRACEAQETIDAAADNHQIYRAEARQHYKQQQKIFKKAQVASRQRQDLMAAFYYSKSNLHAAKLAKANERASKKILEATNGSRQDVGLIDLHLLQISEAISATQAFLNERQRVMLAQGTEQMQVSIITGRGNHSKGGKPKLKPAIKDYLQQSGYRFHMANSGMFSVTLQL